MRYVSGRMFAPAGNLSIIFACSARMQAVKINFIASGWIVSWQRSCELLPPLVSLLLGLSMHVSLSHEMWGRRASTRPLRAQGYPSFKFSKKGAYDALS